MAIASGGTLIVSRALRAGSQAGFESWAARLEQAARPVPGYLSVLWLGQGPGLHHLVFQFRSEADAQAWHDGADYRRLADEADVFSVGLDQVHAGDGARFELPSDASASKWKQFVMTWLTVFPLLLLITGAMRCLLDGWPPAVQLVPSSLILTAVLQWVVMPRVHWWGRYWLLRGANGSLRTE